MAKSKINEGFWDSLITQAKRGALAVSGAAGDKNSQGKLSALNLSTAMYDAFKHYQGETGAEQNEQDMLDFLSKNLGFSDKFSEDQARRFENVLNGYDYEDPADDTEDSQEDEQSNEPQAADGERKEPSLGGDQQQADAHSKTEAKPEATPQADSKPAEEPSAEQSTEEKQAEQGKEPAENSEDEQTERRKDSTERFMQTELYNEMGMQMRGNGGRTPNMILVSPQNANKVKDLITAAKADNKWSTFIDKLAGMGAMTSWANLQELIADQGIEIPKSKAGIAEIMKDALNQAGKLVGTNYVRKADTFIVGVPDKPSGQEFKLRESVQLNEDMNDKELRDFFLKVAQNALKTGEAKSTAKRQISSVKNRINKQGAYKAPGSKTTTPQQQQTTQPSQSAQAAPSTKSTTAVGDANTIKVRLSKADKQLIDDLDGTEIVDAIDSDIPDVKELAKKIMANALADYKNKK